ncbi:MAG: hypothetical protein IIY36_10330 [Lachnospiraceae bacterium]|nr:hypothetical protein [Lachnospiraceae bacterium]
MDNGMNLERIMFKAACPNNEIIYDEFGRPSVMVWIPKFRMNQVITNGSDRVHPAFIVNGKEIDGFYISKYGNTEIEGVGYSMPGCVPRGDVGIRESRAFCEPKGLGWHLTTVQEWGAIALWCKRNGYLPYGNNDHGKDKRETSFRATPATRDEDGSTKSVLTGSGPLTWTHDGTPAGIWDLNGNLSEWMGGFRFVYGELQVLPGNDGADIRNSQEADSDAWRAIDAETGEYLVPDGQGTTPGSIKADYFCPPFQPPAWGSKWRFSANIPESREDSIRRCDMSFIVCDETIKPAAKEFLYALGLIFNEPYFDTKEQYCYHNNGIPEAFMYRGGFWGSGAFAGVFCWSASVGRIYKYEGNGFRASYIPLS